jgi:hypothetical protein
MKRTFTFSLRGGLLVYSSLFLWVLADAQTMTPKYISTGPNSNGFYEYLPAGYKVGNGKKYPLLVYLAGEGELGNGSSQLPVMLDHGPAAVINSGKWPGSFTVNGKTFSFVVISPQFVQTEGDGDIDDVINYAVAHYQVDTGRIYLTGFSLGGSCLWNYISNWTPARTLAAVVPIAAGQMYTGMNGASVVALSNLPVLATANQYDDMVPSSYTVQAVNNINSVVPHCNPQAWDTLFPAYGHEGWTTTYDPNTPLRYGLNMYQWMLQYSRDPGDTLATPPPPPPPTPPQPVALTNYTATAVNSGKQVNVDWTTASEVGNKYFVVQRSTDGVNFINLGTVASAASGGAGASYQFTDNGPVVGNDFYRLERVDSSNSDTLYRILKVVISAPSPPPPPPHDSTPPPVPPPVIALTAYSATVVADGKEVNVNWATAMEKGDKYFIVQRSADSVSFTNLDTVSAASSGGGASYQYTDTDPLTGPGYYRLDRLDSTGKDSLYPVLKVQIAAPDPPALKQTLLIGPNPASGLVYIHWVNTETGEVHVSLTDMQGASMRAWLFQKQGETWDQSIDVAGLPPGAYVLHIQTSTASKVQTIIKE